MEVEQREEEGQLAGAGTEDRLDRDLQDGAGRGGREVGVEVGGEGLRIEVGRAVRVPGSVERDVECGEVQVEHAGDALRGALGVRGRDETHVEVTCTAPQLDPLPLRVGGEGRHAQLGRQRSDVVLGGPDPLATPVDREARLGDLGERAPPDAMAGLEHQDVDPGPGQMACCGQARVTGSDHHHLALAVLLGHAPSLPMGHARPLSATIGAGLAGAARTPSVPCGAWS